MELEIAVKAAEIYVNTKLGFMESILKAIEMLGVEEDEYKTNLHIGH